MGDTLISYAIIINFILIIELTIDLKSVTPYLLAGSSAISILLLILYFNDKYLHLIGKLFISNLFILFELNVIFSPNTFHVMVFWFSFLPFIGLILEGPRFSLITTVATFIVILADFLYVDNTIGLKYAVEIDSFSFMVMGSVYLVSTVACLFLIFNRMSLSIMKIREQKEHITSINTARQKNSEKLQMYQNNLLILSKNETITSGNLDLFLKLCGETIQRVLKIDRISIWKSVNDHKRLNRIFLLQSGVFEDSIFHLENHQFPSYFDAIQNKNYINAADAINHPDTFEFATSYLKPLGIMSMLDCPIRVNDDLYGVICCEQLNEQVHWSLEDVLFVEHISDYISICLQNKEINKLVGTIKSQNEELSIKNGEIETINKELIQSNTALNELNTNLEYLVKQRTNKLEEQNAQLSEYAFINSHLLRAPLARILGLSSLLIHETSDLKDTEMLNALIESTKELDTLISKIGKILYEGNDLSRKDIEEIIKRRLDPRTDSQSTNESESDLQS